MVINLCFSRIHDFVHVRTVTVTCMGAAMVGWLCLIDWALKRLKLGFEAFKIEL